MSIVPLVPRKKTKAIADELADRIVYMSYDDLTPLALEAISQKGKDTQFGKLGLKIARSLGIDDEV